MNCEETQTLLPAHVDGELALSENNALEQHLKTCLACQAKWLNQQALCTAIQKHAPYFNAPSPLENRIRVALFASAGIEKKSTAWLRDWSWPQIGLIFTSIAALAFSLNLYFLAPSAGDLLAQDVVASHVRSLMVDHLADVSSSDQHTVKPWFNGKLDFAPTVQDFSPNGFALVGGRLDYLEQRAVAALVYRHQQHLINVYIWPTNKPPSGTTQNLSLHGYHLAHWNQNEMTYWMISDLNAHDLSQLVSLLQNNS